MKTLVRTVFVFSSLATAAAAQEQQVYSPSVELGAKDWADARIIETKSGDTLTAATLDFCFTQNADFSSGVLILGDFDHVVVPLKINGTKLTGAAASNEGKRAVEVQLTRRASPAQVSYVGTISVGGRSFKISETPLSGENPAEKDLPFLQLEENPKSFGELAPNALAVKIKRDSLPQLVQSLRGSNVVVDLVAGGVDKCVVLRTGFKHVKLVTPPEESQALVARLRKLPYVVNAGWTGAPTGPAQLRIAGGRWIDKGTINRSQVEQELAAAVARYLAAEVADSSWDAKTGLLKITFRRPSLLFPGLGLRDYLNFVALVSLESFGQTDRALLWMESVTGAVVDDGAGPRVFVGTLALYAGPVEGIAIYIDPPVLAGLLKAEWWDGESGSWRK